MVGEALVVPVQAPAAHQSGQGPFDDPTAGKDLEGALPGGLLHDLTMMRKYRSAKATSWPV